ncbi:MAG: alpha-E domain-containing protein [bacterium]
MLSRVADSIYWMNRYIERAENIARIIDANLHFFLDSKIPDAEQWEPLICITGDQNYFFEKYGKVTRENVIYFLTFDKEYDNSIISCLRCARENAKSIREIISLEMWEQINKFYIMLSELSESEITLDFLHEFFEKVKNNCHLFNGISDSTMSRNEGWHFARLGKMLERADKTSRIIDIKYFHILPSVKFVGSTYDILQWSAILKSASGLEMFKKKYKLIKPDKIIEFLITDDEFPRSIKYCISKANESIHSISGTTNNSFSNKPEQSLGMLNAELLYADIDNIIEIGFHEFLDSFQKKLLNIGTDIYSKYFNIEQ